LQSGLQRGLQSRLQSGLQSDSQRGLQRGLQSRLQSDAQSDSQSRLQSDAQSGLQKSLQEAFKEIENREYEISKELLYYSKERTLKFAELLAESLSDFFPSYSDFLKEQFELFKSNNLKEPDNNSYMLLSHNHYYYLLAEELYPLQQSLNVFSEKDRLHLLDIKYLFMMIQSMEILFKNYDRNKNAKIDDKELDAFYCLIEPFLSQFLSEELEGQWEWVKEYYRSEKIIRYIFKYQEIPSRLSLRYFIFNPDKAITLSFKEVYRLLNLFFKMTIQSLKENFPEQFELPSSLPLE